MNRNTEAHFSALPHANVSRSRFDRSHDHKTTFNAGSLIPIYVDEVLPGDTFSLDTAFVLRMGTPVFPVMDNCYIDFYYFFVPNRLVWSHWEEFNGENKTGPWKQEVEYKIPHFVLPEVDYHTKVVPVGSIGDYMGLPQAPFSKTDVGAGTETVNSPISVLPFRAYELIWNEWFRDENLQSPCMIAEADGINTEWDPEAITGGERDWNVLNGICSWPAPVCKYHDYFTSALPEPQKGDPVSLPLAVPDNSLYPVFSTDDDVDYRDVPAGSNIVGQRFIPEVGSTGWPGVQPGGISELGFQHYSTVGTSEPRPVQAFDRESSESYAESVGVMPSNLWASLTGLQLNAVTINSLRQAFQLQKLYEKDARGGTRYIEILKSHFGVSSGDARLQRPEYLGGRRVPINISQVLQTSSTDSTSPQGNTAAYSLTTGRDSSFTRSFVEHGYIIGLCCVRQDHTYQQGIERFWTRETRFDFYWPVFANIGEQPIFNREIYMTGTATDKEPFGFQEAWADYRYKPSRTSGYFRSGVDGSLDAWHYGDYYTALPILGPDWIKGDMSGINRTLAVPATKEKPIQFLADFYFDVKCTRPMPLYSIPGLVDHH